MVNDETVECDCSDRGMEWRVREEGGKRDEGRGKGKSEDGRGKKDEEGYHDSSSRQLKLPLF